MTTDRPTGVTIVAVLQLIGGVVGLLVGLANLVLREVMELPDLEPLMMMFGVLSILEGGVGLIAGYGLWTLKGWGWLLAVVFDIYGILGRVALLFIGPHIPIIGPPEPGQIFGLVLSGFVLRYMYRPHVRRAFGRA